MNVWEWFTATASVDTLLTTLGLGAIAILFATDRIITKGQHLRRVQDIVEYHSRELLGKDERISDSREVSKNSEAAARIERERADKGWDALGEITQTLTQVLHVLESLDRALAAPEGAPHERP